MHRSLIALFAFAGPAAAAIAGDHAEREIIGFSPDGTAFAFEEHGIEDGSGFPYANIYVIDTGDDSWVAGTPIRVRIESDYPSYVRARTEAYDRARAILDRHRIGSRGMLVVSNPATETSADPHRVAFVPRLVVPPSDASMDIEITERDMPASDCPDVGEPYKGFRLVLTGSRGAKVLHDDTRIPGSRRCPLGYAISDVVTYYPETGDPALAVILSVFSVGFEGRDRRFLAVTTRLKE